MQLALRETFLAGAGTYRIGRLVREQDLIPGNEIDRAQTLGQLRGQVIAGQFHGWSVAVLCRVAEVWLVNWPPGQLVSCPEGAPALANRPESQLVRWLP